MSELKITQCRVRLCDPPDAKLKAFAQITFNRAFQVRDLKVINGTTGVFVAMPSRRRPDGTFKDIAHPMNSETRAMIERAVLREYAVELQRSGQAWPAPPAHLDPSDVETEGGVAPRAYTPAELAALAAEAGSMQRDTGDDDERRNPTSSGRGPRR